MDLARGKSLDNLDDQTTLNASPVLRVLRLMQGVIVRKFMACYTNRILLDFHLAARKAIHRGVAARDKVAAQMKKNRTEGRLQLLEQRDADSGSDSDV